MRMRREKETNQGEGRRTMGSRGEQEQDKVTHVIETVPLIFTLEQQQQQRAVGSGVRPSKFVS